MADRSSHTLLGGLSPAAFLRGTWQREARLVRQAIPRFEGFLDRAGMFALARREDVESRLVVRQSGRWTLEHGPFTARRLAALPARDWTLLVQGVNLHDDRGAALLDRFDFLPRARLDDLMVSYAAPGGGVGPHFDSYDVFLLQGSGRRRWRVSTQHDLELVPDLPLRILARFRPEQSWVLDPGDMLYLPPRYAHDGVAEEACLTWSIGFRAPAWGELASQFLSDLADHVELDGRYADPGAAVTRSPGRLPERLVRDTEAALRRVTWSRRHVEDFLGRQLSEPKPQVFFDPPVRPLGPAAFSRALASRALALHRKSIMLYDGRAVYLNGEALSFPRGVPAALRELADCRRVQVRDPAAPVTEALRDWFNAGFVVLERAPATRADKALA